MTKRIGWVDAAKGVSIALMVIGHMPGIPFFLRAVIFSFHMPLFFLLNGYLLQSRNPRTVLSRSIRSLLLPYVHFCLLMVSLDALGASTVSEAGERFLQGLNSTVLGISYTSTLFTRYGSVWLVWFVICLFFARNIYAGVIALCRKLPAAAKGAVILALSAAGYLIGRYAAFLPWSLDVALYCLLFLAVGDMLRRKNILERVRIGWYLIPLAVWVLLLLFTRTHIELATRQYPFIYGGAIAAIAGSLCVIRLAMGTERVAPLLSRILAWYGKNSLLILCIHCLEMRFIPWSKILPDSILLHWYLQAALRFLLITVSALLAVWIRKAYRQMGDRLAARSSGTLSGKNRLAAPDVVRGIGMLAVIAGHMEIGFINRLVYLWHLPVFFLVSGYFLKKQPESGFLKGRAKRLLVPYYLTCLGMCLISALRAFFRHEAILPVLGSWAGGTLYASGGSLSTPVTVSGVGAIWFLWALFIALWVVHFFIERKYGLICIAGIAVSGWAVFRFTGIWLPLSLSAGTLCSIYVAIGFMARKHGITADRLPLPVLLLLGVAGAVGAQLFKGFYLVQNTMGNGWLDVLFSLCASIPVIAWAERIGRKETVMQRVLRFYGANSMLILCLHIVELKTIGLGHMLDRLIQMLPFSVNPVQTAVALFLARVAFVTLGAAVLRRIPPVRRIFGG